MDLCATSTAPALPWLPDAELEAAVRARRSCRTFDGRPLEPRHGEWLRAALADPARLVGPHGHRARLHLVEFDHGPGEADREIGTYGYVVDYPAALVVIGPDAPLALVDLAHVAHGIVLQLTHLGVDSVWLGAAFRREDLLGGLELAAGELIGALIPIGYARGRKRMIDRVAKLVLRTTKRKAMGWSFHDGRFGQPLDEARGPFGEALELARWAPSAKNEQPWRAVVRPDGRGVDLYVEFGLRHQVGVGRKMYACNPEYLDLGTFIRSLDVGLAARGVRGRWRAEDPGLALPTGVDLEYLTSFVPGP